MVDGIRGRSGSLANEAILAAMKRQAARTEEVRGGAAAIGGPSQEVGEAGDAKSFAEAVREGLADVDAQVKDSEALPQDLVSGEVGGVTEVATRLKTAELTFRFSMEIRNKLIDAYREVMRMQV